MCFYFLWAIIKGNRYTLFRKWQTLEKQEDIKYLWTEWFSHKEALPSPSKTQSSETFPQRLASKMQVPLGWHRVMIDHLADERAHGTSRHLWGTLWKEAETQRSMFISPTSLLTCILHLSLCIWGWYRPCLLGSGTHGPVRVYLPVPFLQCGCKIRSFVLLPLNLHSTFRHLVLFAKAPSDRPPGTIVSVRSSPGNRIRLVSLKRRDLVKGHLTGFENKQGILRHLEISPAGSPYDP